MNDEMFMQLLEMVRDAGEGGYALALIYLCYDYFSSVLIAGTIIGVIVLICKTVRALINIERTLQQVAEMVDKSWYGELSDRESQAIIDAVRKRISENDDGSG